MKYDKPVEMYNRLLDGVGSGVVSGNAPGDPDVRKATPK